MTALNTRIDGHLDGLEVGCELQVADLLRVQLGDGGEQLVQPRVQRLLEHQHLAVTRVLHQPLHELRHLQPNIFRYRKYFFLKVSMSKWRNSTSSCSQACGGNICEQGNIWLLRIINLINSNNIYGSLEIMEFRLFDNNCALCSSIRD